MLKEEKKKQKISLEIWLALGTIFVYSSTILMQYGVISYYGIPYFIIEPSIRDNIIFTYTLIKVLFNLAPEIIFKVFAPTLAGIGFLTFAIYKLFSYTKIRNFDVIKQKNFHKFLNKLKWPLFIIFLLFTLNLFYILGFKTAEIHKDVYKLSEECVLAPQENYFISEFFQGKPIILYYNDQKEILNKFSIVDITNSGCYLEKTTIEGLKKSI